MESEHAAVFKVKECPVGGATNRVKYGFNEIIINIIAEFAGGVVGWFKRRK